MKKIKYFIIVVISLFIIPLTVNAASGTIKVTSTTSRVVVGNKITFTVTLSSLTPMISWEMDLNYDRNYLELVSTNSEGNGTRMVSSSASGTTKKTYTFTFKTKKTGSTTVKVDTYDAYAFDDLSKINLS